MSLSFVQRICKRSKRGRVSEVKESTVFLTSCPTVFQTSPKHIILHHSAQIHGIPCSIDSSPGPLRRSALSPQKPGHLGPRLLHPAFISAWRQVAREYLVVLWLMYNVGSFACCYLLLFVEVLGVWCLCVCFFSQCIDCLSAWIFFGVLRFWCFGGPLCLPLDLSNEQKVKARGWSGAGRTDWMARFVSSAMQAKQRGTKYQNKSSAVLIVLEAYWASLKVHLHCCAFSWKGSPSFSFHRNPSQKTCWNP